MDEGICLFMRESCEVLPKICVLFEEYWWFGEEKRTFSVKNWEHLGNSCWVLKTSSGGRLNCGKALSFAFKASISRDALPCFISLSTFSGCFAAICVFRLHLCQVRWSQKLQENWGCFPHLYRLWFHKDVYLGYVFPHSQWKDDFCLPFCKNWQHNSSNLKRPEIEIFIVS